MINFTDNAIKEIRRLFQKIQNQDMALRLVVKGDSCCGNSLIITLDSLISQLDKTFYIDDVKVVVNKKYYTKLKNIMVDYSNDLITGGFKFVNPDKSKDCGCHL